MPLHFEVYPFLDIGSASVEIDMSGGSESDSGMYYDVGLGFGTYYTLNDQWHPASRPERRFQFLTLSDDQRWSAGRTRVLPIDVLGLAPAGTPDNPKRRMTAQQSTPVTLLPPTPGLPDPETVRESDLETLFAGAATFALGQAWTDSVDAAFRPARVRVRHAPSGLGILAELEDECICVDPGDRPNDYAFRHSDVIEVFLRPMPQPVYYEFHVTPANVPLQLRFPSEAAFREFAMVARAAKEAGRPFPPSPFLVAGKQFASRAWKTPQGWAAYLVIPFTSLPEAGAPAVGDRWLMSFSRYDHGSGPGPVLSSSSQHRQVDFHCNADWRVCDLG